MEKLKWYRVLGVLAVVATTALSVWIGTQWPALAAAATSLNSIVCWYVGKLLGVPLDDVIKAALQVMQPDRAVAVTVEALRSMPPANAETVTQKLLQSIPPDAQSRIVAFVGDSLHPPPSPPSQPPTPPAA